MAFPATAATPLAAPGLDGVVVADTRLSEVDGERGRLVIAGRSVEDLAGSVDFAAACALLWGEPESAAARADGVRTDLGRARVHAFAELPRLGGALALTDGMDALRAAIAQLPSTAIDGPEAIGESARLSGAVATCVAAWARARSGQPPIAPDPSLGHAADLLRMIGDAPAPPAIAAALDTYLVTVIDHGMNASTFAARVVASTGSDLVSSVVAAIGALKGPLHGGAPGPVLDMLDAIGAPDRATAWLEGELAARRRIMGMGHRIYHVRDPRAAVLELALERLVAAGHASRRLALARAVEQAATGALAARHPDRPLRANVEFYTAVLLDALGLDRALFSPLFAVGRVAGWCAHVAEQRASGRLIRPSSRYVGPQSRRQASEAVNESRTEPQRRGGVQR